MTYKVPDLQYAYNALEPHIDEETMILHHTKHHNAYATNLNAAIEKFIQQKVYAAFAQVVKLVPAQCIVNGEPTKEQILAAVREVKMLSGASQVVLVGTDLALSQLPEVETEATKNEQHLTGALRFFQGIPLVELPQAIEKRDPRKLVQDDNLIYIVPNNIGKPIKMIVEPELIDINESGVRVDDTIEFAVRFSFGLKVITGRAMGVIELAQA